MYASGGGDGIVRRRAEHEQLAQGARADGIARRAVARVEAPLEADLDEDPGLLDLVDHRVDRIELERDRLLAERGNPGAGGEPEERRVAVGGGRDHERVDAGVDESLDRRCRVEAEAAGDLSRSSSIRVGDRDRGDAVEGGQRLGVEAADPAHAREPDVQIAISLDGHESATLNG